MFRTTTPVRKMMVIPCIQRSRVATVKRNVIKQEATGATTKQTPNDLDTLYDAEDILFNDIESKNGSGDHVFKKSVGIELIRNRIHFNDSTKLLY